MTHDKTLKYISQNDKMTIQQYNNTSILYVYQTGIEIVHDVKFH